MDKLSKSVNKENDQDGLFSTTFTTALANCTTDEQMANLVAKDFDRFFPNPTADEIRLPTFNESQPAVSALLEYLKKKKLSYQMNSIKEVFRKVKIRIKKLFHLLITKNVIIYVFLISKF